MAGQSGDEGGPLYSVVIPAYNAENTLGACLKALAAQSVPRGRFEIIVVDDGSGDRTGDIARIGADLCLRQDNAGPATARNRGAAATKGAIILFTDSDCEPTGDWLMQMTKPFADPEVAGVKGAYLTRQRELAARFAQAEFADRYQLLLKSRYIDMVDTYSAAFRREVFLEANGFDQGFSTANNEDTELSYRLSAQGFKLVFNPRALVYHRHPASFAKYLRTKFWRGYWRMVVYRLFPEKALKDTYTPLVLKAQTAATALALALFPLAALWPGLLAAPLLILAGVLASSLPFAARAFRVDAAVGLVSPLAILARSVVFALGSLYGLARSWR